MLHIRYFQLFAIIGTLFFVSGCVSYRQRGALDVHRNFVSYNNHIYQATKEQVLLNALRAKFGQMPYFFQITSISSSLTYENSSTLGFEYGRTKSAEPSILKKPSLGAARSFAEKPTITYTPLQGDEYAKSILTPIPLEHLVLLARTWTKAENREILFKSLIKYIGAKPVAKEKGLEDDSVAKAIKYLVAGDLSIVKRPSISASKVTTAVSLENHLEANKQSLVITQTPIPLIGSYDIKIERPVVSLGIKPSKTATDAGALENYLEVAKDGVRLFSHTHALIEQDFNMSDSAYRRSVNIQRPVGVTIKSLFQVFTDLGNDRNFIKKCSDCSGKKLVQTTFRGERYCIPDSEKHRIYFQLLMTLLQLASATPRTTPSPTLVLPVQ